MSPCHNQRSRLIQMRRCLVLLQLVNFSFAKLKCYYDQVKLPDSRRISAWRDFKYPVQCQHECLYSGIEIAFQLLANGSYLKLPKTQNCLSIPLHRSTCRGWSWSGPYASPAYACYLSQSKINFEAVDSNESFISGPKNCTDISLNIIGKGELFEDLSSKVFQKKVQ